MNILSTLGNGEDYAIKLKTTKLFSIATLIIAIIFIVTHICDLVSKSTII